MKHFLLHVALPAFLFALTVVHAEKPSLTLTQTARYPAGFDLNLSAKSSLAGFLILTKSSTQLPTYTPEVYSWSIKINPLPQLSLLTGSIRAEGLPARANNPVFNLTSPFFTPSSLQGARILSPGSTKQTGNSAFELSAFNFRIAAFTGALHSLNDPSWFFVSKVFPAFSLNDTAASVSFFVGTRHTSAADRDESWFLPERYTPPARVFLPGTEISVAKGRVTAAATAFLDIEQCRKPASAFRAETSFTGKTVSIAAGGYCSDSEFTNMDGSKESILNRVFFAPALEFQPVPLLNIEAHLGAIIFSDTVRREKYYEADIRTFTGGTGLFVSGNNFHAKAQVMKQKNDYSVSASVHVRDLLSPAIRITVSGQTRKEGSTLASELSIKPLTWISAGIGVKRTAQENNTKPCVSGELSCTLKFKSRHLDWNLSAGISASNGHSPGAGSIVLKTVIK